MNESVTVVAAKSETVTVALHRAKNGRYAHGGGCRSDLGGMGGEKKALVGFKGGSQWATLR